MRDLPKSKLGVDVDNEFEPHYIVPQARRRTSSTRSRKLATRANTIYLATDPDREGEAISWHLVEAAGLEAPADLQRVVFHEITPGAIREAFEHPREIDYRARRRPAGAPHPRPARRLQDQPAALEKVRRGLSAGRVQSAA